MVSMEHTIRHAAWADDLLFTMLADLPPRALACSYASPEWNVAAIAAHIVSGGRWCRYVLGGPRWSDLAPVTSAADVELLRPELASIYDFMLEQNQRDDGPVTYRDSDGPRTFLRSTVLAQAAYHGTEHRTHIAVALELNGYTTLRSDDFDVWAYEVQGRSASQLRDASSPRS